MKRQIKLHGKIGLFVTLFLIVFVVSGIVIQHTESLKTDSLFVKSELLLDHYGFDTPPSSKAFNVFAIKDHKYLVQIDEQVYFKHRSLLQNVKNVILAVAELPDILVLATSDQIFLFDKEMQLIDILSPPAPLLQMQVVNDRLIIQTTLGTRTLNADFLEWLPADNAVFPAANIVLLPDHEVEAYWKLHRQQLLSWTRVIQDIHSGRIMGKWGIWTADLAAIMLLVLAVSGLRLLLRERE
ncbi:MAG: PepSY domain-containing protein [Pseudomonadales bacterium]|nr:PepSY domain-containing protein [Pseudomonadales bacterium]